MTRLTQRDERADPGKGARARAADHRAPGHGSSSQSRRSDRPASAAGRLDLCRHLLPVADAAAFRRLPLADLPCGHARAPCFRRLALAPGSFLVARGVLGRQLRTCARPGIIIFCCDAVAVPVRKPLRSGVDVCVTAAHFDDLVHASPKATARRHRAIRGTP